MDDVLDASATDEVRRRSTDPPGRRCAAAHRQGTLPGRPDLAPADLVRVRSLAARACADPLDRHRRRVARAWRAGGVHRCRLRERRAVHAEGGDAAQEARRIADVRAAASRAGDRPRALCRRSGRDGDRRDAGAGQGRRRTGRGGLRSAAVGDIGRGGGASRMRPRVWDENPDNISHTYERGDRQATEAAFARAARIVKRRYVITPRPCAVHGAARCDRHLRSGGRSLHAVRRRELSAPRAQHARQHGVQGAGEQSARGVPRRGRRLRRQGLAVCRAPADAVGGAQARTAGQVALRTLGSRSWPTSTGATMSARSSWRSTTSGKSSACGCTCWPASVPMSDPTGSSSRRSADRHRGRGVRHPGGLCQHRCGAVEHQPDRAIPRRRPAGGDLSDRAGDGGCGAGTAHRPDRAAPAQHHCRMRRCRSRVRSDRTTIAASSNATWRSRSRRPTTPALRCGATHRAREACCAASAWRTRSSRRRDRRRNMPRSASIRAAAPSC